MVLTKRSAASGDENDNDRAEKRLRMRHSSVNGNVGSGARGLKWLRFASKSSSETQGRLVGARGNKSGNEMKRRRFTSKAEKAPGNRLLPSLQNRRISGASAIQEGARETRERARSARQEISACKHTIVYALPTVLANGSC